LFDRDELHQAFDQAVFELNQSRGTRQPATDFYQRIDDSVFEEGYSALIHAKTPPPLHGNCAQIQRRITIGTAAVIRSSGGANVFCRLSHKEH
jgi:hypothetical protein